MKLNLALRIAFFVFFLMKSVLAFSQITEQYSFTESEKEAYLELKERIEEYERQVLKQKVQSINDQLESGEISSTEAENQKTQAAEIAVNNINDLNELVDAYTTYVKRNYDDFEIDFTNLDFSDADFDLPFSGLENLAEVLETLGNFFQEIKDDLKNEDALVIQKREEIIEKREALIQAKKELKEMRQKEFEAKKETIISERNELKDQAQASEKEVDTSRIRGLRSDDALVVAVAFNNAIPDGGSINNTGVRFGGSRTFEIGYARDTRVFNHTNWLRIKYGFSLQFNGLKPEGNRIFAIDGDQTFIQDYEFNLRKNKFRMDNLIFPLHLQMGTGGVKTSRSGKRYISDHNFKVGVGGFVGLNLLNTNKLRYTNLDGQRIRERIRDDFNTNNFLYGLSAYAGWDDVSFFVQYNLNPIFTNNPVDVHNVQFGVRFDFN